MAKLSLAERVAALESKVGNKSIEQQFREQAELIDRLFIYRFDELERRWDVRIANLETRLENSLETKLGAKLEEKLDAKLAKLERTLDEKLEHRLEEKLEPLRRDLAAVKGAVMTILTRL